MTTASPAHTRTPDAADVAASTRAADAAATPLPAPPASTRAADADATPLPAPPASTRAANADATPLPSLTPAQLDAFGRELDALRARTIADLGQRDVDHIRAMIRLVRYTEVAGRALLHFGVGPITFVVGTTALAASKILENMEVGHNVMHGQYDWTGDPALAGNEYEWDTACTGDDWRHSHNYEHHTFTNVLGRDRDIGYSLLRVTGAQRWYPRHVVQLGAAAVLALLFQYGVGVHDLRIADRLGGKRRRPRTTTASSATAPTTASTATAPTATATHTTAASREPTPPKRSPRAFFRKLAWQLGKDYALYPALALANAPRILAGNLVANLARNVWSFAIIFCGHFPAGVAMFPPESLADESRGAWYFRQLAGSANIEGGRAFHIASGHLSHQIEHHLFPDIPASRYPELAPHVRAICARYGIPYNTGSFARQLGSVAAQLAKYSLPSSAHARSLLTNVQ